MRGGRDASSPRRHIQKLQSSKFAAISWPSAGASKTARRKTPGGRGEPEGRAVPHTHTCSFQHTLSLLLLSLCHSHTHTLPPLISHPISPVTFSPFALLRSRARLPRRGGGGGPGVCQSGGAYVSQGALLRDSEGHGLGAQSPILHFPLSPKQEAPWEEKKER